MRQLSILLLIALWAVPIFGQTHPSDPGATIITTFSGSVPLPSYSTTWTDYEITVWLTSSGSYDYQLDIADLSFHGAVCSGVDATPLAEIVETVAAAAVAKAVVLGYPGCGFTSFNKGVHFWTTSCGARVGSGCTTMFVPCSGEWYYRAYTVACPGTGAAATVTQGSISTPYCDSQGCEKTYVESLQ